MKLMIYDVIIIGAGSAGLFAGASLPKPVRGLIIEKSPSPGKKLLMSGAGQCNLTHGGSMKDFIPHYGENGSTIRSVLYQFNNLSVMGFFERQGLPLFEREDGKVFPKSLQAKDVLKVLTAACKNKGLDFLYSSPVHKVTFAADIKADTPDENANRVYRIQCGNRHYEARKLIVATGGCSYPTTGSDGSFFSVLKELKVEVRSTKPALVPVFVEAYPYQQLSGISFPKACITIPAENRSAGNRQQNTTEKQQKRTCTDALLLTHTSFSGPAALNLSRYLSPGMRISISYDGRRSYEQTLEELASALRGNNKQFLTVLYGYLNPQTQETSAPNAISKEPYIPFPKRFLEALCLRCSIDPTIKAAQLSKKDVQAIVTALTRDMYTVSGLGGYNTAMVTTGGVSLAEINMKTMESKKNPGLFFAGEVLDVDGDTGGYNLQFAFSSGYLAAQSL